MWGYGTIGKDEFKKALETLGCVWSDIELSALFNKYDTQKCGKLDFEELAGQMALRGSGNNPNVNPVFALSREPPHTVIDKIRCTLKAKGIYGVRALITLFKKFDTNSDSRLDRHEIQWVLKQNGQNLSPSEFERLFKYFDKNNDGFISTSEFIRGVRGELSHARAASVADAWKKIAPKGDLSTEDFEKAFDIECVESYRNGQMTKSQVLSELMA